MSVQFLTGPSRRPGMRGRGSPKYRSVQKYSQGALLRSRKVNDG